MPASGAQWMEVAGAYAMFDGVDSPCTQTFGLGLFQMPTSEDMTRLEAFFRERQSSVMHEVCPLTDAALLPMLIERGYRPMELSNVLYLPLEQYRSENIAAGKGVQVRVAVEQDHDVWAKTSAEGWSEFQEFAPMMADLSRVSAAKKDGALFLAELEGKPVAAGALSLHAGVALFAGASTIPAWRRRGAQQALLQRRFQHAVEVGCDLAMIVTAPGSSSQRNSERYGFRVAYTRTKWLLAAK
jgi:GNAT superfamily N-acetyltransferase